MVGTSGHHLRTHRHSFTRRREGRMGADGRGISRARGETLPARRAIAAGERFLAPLSWRQNNPWIPLAINASDASSITTVAVQPTTRRCAGSENSFTIAEFADMIISIAISGTAT